MEKTLELAAEKAQAAEVVRVDHQSTPVEFKAGKLNLVSARHTTGWGLRVAACMCLTVLLAGCTSLFDPDGSELDENMDRWANSGIEDYRFRFQRLCFCVSVDPVEIDVIDGQIVSITLIETGEPPHPDLVDTYLTIDGLFAEIQDAMDRNAFSLSVSYHETLGYPTSIDIDYQANAIDEEMSYRASELVELN